VILFRSVRGIVGLRRVKESMSAVLTAEDQTEIVKEGSSQALTCGDPPHRRDDRI
jgi:hypothetical protein